MVIKSNPRHYAHRAKVMPQIMKADPTLDSQPYARFFRLSRKLLACSSRGPRRGEGNNHEQSGARLRFHVEQEVAQFQIKLYGPAPRDFLLKRSTPIVIRWRSKSTSLHLMRSASCSRTPLNARKAQVVRQLRSVVFCNASFPPLINALKSSGVRSRRFGVGGSLRSFIPRANRARVRHRSRR